MANRKRSVPIVFWVSPEEKDTIIKRMDDLGTKNMSAFLRKMALNGYMISLSLPELKEILSLMRRISNNLNQLTKRVHVSNRIYDADLQDIQRTQQELWEALRQILLRLGKLS